MLISLKKRSSIDVCYNMNLENILRQSRLGIHLHEMSREETHRYIGSQGREQGPSVTTGLLLRVTKLSEIRQQ